MKLCDRAKKLATAEVDRQRAKGLNLVLGYLHCLDRKEPHVALDLMEEWRVSRFTSDRVSSHHKNCTLVKLLYDRASRNPDQVAIVEIEMLSNLEKRVLNEMKEQCSIVELDKVFCSL